AWKPSITLGNWLYYFGGIPLEGARCAGSSARALGPCPPPPYPRKSENDRGQPDERAPDPRVRAVSHSVASSDPCYLQGLIELHELIIASQLAGFLLQAIRLLPGRLGAAARVKSIEDARNSDHGDQAAKYY